MSTVPLSPPATDLSPTADVCRSPIEKPVFKKLTGFVALCAWVAVLLQFAITFPLLLSKGYSWGAALLKLFTFFTICTNFLVAIFYTGRALHWADLLKPRVWAFIEAGLLVNILFVATGFQAMGLRAYRQVTGLEIIPEALLHYINPLLVLIHWLVFRERGGSKLHDPVWWVCYLFIYEMILLAYGSIWRTYPYPALNADKIGYPQLALNSLFLLGFWMIMAYAVVCFDRFSGREKTSRL